MSFELPREIINNNYQSTLNLFESVRVLKLKSLIIHCSTSEVYGNVSKKDVPIKESLSIRPVSPYAVSKAYQELVNLNIVENRRGLGMFVTEPAKNQLLKIEKEKFLKGDWPAILRKAQQLDIDLVKLVNKN